MLETVLLVSLIVSVAALVVPTFVSTAAGGETERARVGCEVLVSSLQQFRRDTGHQPCGYRGAAGYTWLFGPGAMPRFERQPDGEAGNFSWFVTEDRMSGGNAWTGPYLHDLVADPWGRSYVAYVGALWPAQSRHPDAGRFWVLSAGPDGIVQTRATDLVPVADDVGICGD